MNVRIREWLPELYMIASAVGYWVMTTLLNPFAIGLLLVLVVVFVTKRTIPVWIVSLLFLLINLYMAIAMVDELNEFPSFDWRAAELFVFGTMYLGLNIAVAIWMMVKWGRRIASPV